MQAKRASQQHRHDDRRRGDHHGGGRGGGMHHRDERPRFQEAAVQPRLLNQQALQTVSSFGPRGTGRGGGGRTAPANQMPARQQSSAAEVSLRPNASARHNAAQSSVASERLPPPPARAPEPVAPSPAAAAKCSDMPASQLQTGVKNVLGEFAAHGSVAEATLALRDMVAERGARPASLLCFLFLGLCNVHKEPAAYLEAVPPLLAAAQERQSGWANAADVAPALERLVAREAAVFFEENISSQAQLAVLVAQHVVAGTITFEQVRGGRQGGERSRDEGEGWRAQRAAPAHASDSQCATWITALDHEDPDAEDSVFVDSGNAASFVAALLAAIRDAKDEGAAKDAWAASGLTAAKLSPSYFKDAEKVAAAEKAGLGWVL